VCLLRGYMSFVHRHAPQAKPTAIDECLVIQGDCLLARPDAATTVKLPAFEDLANWSEAAVLTPLHAGLLDERPLWLCAIDNVSAAAPAGWAWQDTRALLSSFTAAQLHAISCARQLAWWNRRHRFCGQCGTPTVDVSEERAKRCPKCGALFFPSASSAVIVAITRGDQLLLGHNRNFRPGMFSLLAGFVDPGETLEQAVVREVHEEVGLEIADLHYVSSQPWAFPNSLMTGFRATYRRGEIQVDGKEIEAAGWYTRDQLPEIPRPGTVARLLIDSWQRERA